MDDKEGGGRAASGESGQYYGYIHTINYTCIWQQELVCHGDGRRAADVGLSHARVGAEGRPNCCILNHFACELSVVAGCHMCRLQQVE